jgi:hypothetical protein
MNLIAPEEAIGVETLMGIIKPAIAPCHASLKLAGSELRFVGDTGLIRSVQKNL